MGFLFFDIIIKKATNKGTYIMITKFKTIKTGIGFDFDVEFKNKKINCIIGKNGIGKTQLLENMAKSLFFSHSMFLKDKKYKYGSVFYQKKIYDKLKDYTLKLPIGIEINNQIIKDENRDKWRYVDFKNIQIKNKNFVCDKPIVFVGAQNRGFTKNIDTENIKILPDSQGRFVDSINRSFSYLNGNGLENEEIANWFVSRLILNPNFVTHSENKTNEVITILKLIEKLEPSLKLIKDNQLSILYHNGELLFDGTPLDKLSTGFISIIKIFQEIIASYGGWSNENDLSQIDGIVFIDEIEAHLHISWQTKIINILKQFFPNTTFYISTHSPLVLAGLKDGEAYELYKDSDFVKTKNIENIENYFLNDIVKEFFGVDLNKNKIENYDNNKTNKAKKKLNELLEVLKETEK